MNPEEAGERARGLLNVIETMYELKIVNLETVIETITGITMDEARILAICTALNSWVAMNPAVQGRAVEIPIEFLTELSRRV
jgi:hypothetical protein